MKTSKKRKSWIPNIFLGIAICVILGSWSIFAFITPNAIFGDMSLARRGQWGDTFGSLNALFSGLALLFLIVAVYLQRKELKVYQQEIQNQNSLMQKETFERTFFNLLDMIEKRYHSSEYYFKYYPSSESAIFGTLEEEIARQGLEAIKYDHGTEEPLHAYVKATGKMAFEQGVSEEDIVSLDLAHSFSPYVSLLYRTLLFIDDTKFSDCREDKKFYTDMIRNRMSNEELVVIFFVGMMNKQQEEASSSDIDCSELKRLINTYEFFYNISLKDEWYEKVISYDRSAFGDKLHPQIDEKFDNYE